MEYFEYDCPRCGASFAIRPANADEPDCRYCNADLIPRLEA